MFNLTVSEAHTFYVGADGWLVHNCSTALGKAMGKAGDPRPPSGSWNPHHIIPEQAGNDPFVLRAKAAGWEMDAAHNGVWLPTDTNSALDLAGHGNHPAYNKYVREQLAALENAAKNGGWTDVDVRIAMAQLQSQLRGEIKAIGGSNRLNMEYKLRGY